MSELAFLISSLSLYNKEQEFRAWLVEERKINPETTSKEQTKKEFARFVEDYNTGTFVVHLVPYPFGVPGSRHFCEVG